MKIVYTGTPKSDYPWSNRRWVGQYECGTIVELHDDDAEDVRGYRQDQFDSDAELVNVFCPVCKKWHNFYPAETEVQS